MRDPLLNLPLMLCHCLYLFPPFSLRCQSMFTPFHSTSSKTISLPAFVRVSRLSPCFYLLRVVSFLPANREQSAHLHFFMVKWYENTMSVSFCPLLSSIPRFPSPSDCSSTDQLLPCVGSRILTLFCFLMTESVLLPPVAKGPANCFPTIPTKTSLEPFFSALSTWSPYNRRAHFFLPLWYMSISFPSS